jgi:hypothetical protein
MVENFENGKREDRKFTTRSDDLTRMSTTEEKDENHASTRLVASISCQGVAIGQCLNDALRSLESSEGGRHERQPPSKRQKISIDSEAVDRIMQTFGEAVADTQLESNCTKSTPSAPRALLKGRLDHYNRVGKNWRILIDHVKLKERAPISHEKKKRGDKRSLWQVGGVGREEIAIEQKVQILAYNDS